MAVKIRLKRLGKIRAPHYRVVIMDSRAKRDGRAIEEIGKYHPTQEPSLIEIDSERAQYWLGVGAQPSEQVAVLLKVTGDWQKFKGLPGAEGTLRVAEARVDKRAVFEAAARATADEPKDGATTAKKRGTPKKAASPDAPDQAAAPESAPAEPEVATVEPAPEVATVEPEAATVEPASEAAAAEPEAATVEPASEAAAAEPATPEPATPEQAMQDQAITEHAGLSAQNAGAEVTPATATVGDGEPSSGAEVDQTAVPAGGAKSES